MLRSHCPGRKRASFSGLRQNCRPKTVHPRCLVTSLLPYPGVRRHFYSPCTGHPLPPRGCNKDRTQPPPDKCFRCRSGQDSDPRRRGRQGKRWDGRRSPSTELQPWVTSRQNPRVFLGRGGGLGRLEAGAPRIPREERGGENVRAQEWALETAGGSPPPSAPSCPLSSRPVISRCVHARARTHIHTPPHPRGKEQPQAADRRLPGPGVADVHTILMGKCLTMNRLPGPVLTGEHHSESSISLKISSDTASK